MTKSTCIGFIGAGNMASAVIRGLINTGTPAANIWASAPSERRLTDLAQNLKIHTTQSNLELVQAADVVLLAVKPQVMPAVCTEIASHVNSDTLILSLAAGIPCASIAAWLGEGKDEGEGEGASKRKRAIVRCMPNTPAQIQMGATGLYANGDTSDQQKSTAENILRCVGLTCWLEKETLIDAVTAVAGSGPAYFYLFMEAIIDAACAQGLDRDTAIKLTKQTALGAASLAYQSTDDLCTLRERVTSPKGTTEYALRSFAADDFNTIVANAVSAGYQRARELANIANH